MPGGWRSSYVMSVIWRHSCYARWLTTHLLCQVAEYSVVPAGIKFQFIWYNGGTYLKSKRPTRYWHCCDPCFQLSLPPLLTAVPALAVSGPVPDWRTGTTNPVSAAQCTPPALTAYWWTPGRVPPPGWPGMMTSNAASTRHPPAKLWAATVSHVEGSCQATHW